MKQKKKPIGESPIDSLHAALTSDEVHPTITESDFKQHFMDIFVSPDEMEDNLYALKRKDWIGRVSHSEMSPVRIVDDNSGKDLCIVPALIDSSSIDRSDGVGDSIGASIDRFHKESGHFPNADKKLDAAVDNIMAHRIIANKDNKWDGFMTHFGLYPDAGVKSEEAKSPISDKEEAADELFE